VTSPARELAADVLTHSYLVAGVPCSVSAGPQVIELVDDTYGAYLCLEPAEQPYAVSVSTRDGGLAISDSLGRGRRCTDESDAAFAAIEAVVRQVTDRLAGRGVFAIHAASLVRDGRGIIICGRSRTGKTTLALALLASGFGLLSDEFALSDPDCRTILPYHRGVHIRPGTPELVPELAFLTDRPQHPLSGGFQWTVRAEELDRLFHGCLTGASELHHVVLLGARGGHPASSLEPVPKGVAAVELLRQTTATPAHFDAVMSRMACLVEDTSCLQLRPGPLRSSVELLSDLVGGDRARG
jgi:hypothetical protein